MRIVQGTERGIAEWSRDPAVLGGLRAGVARVLSHADADFEDAVQDGWVTLMRQREVRSPVSLAFHAGRSAAVEIVRRRERRGFGVPLDEVHGRLGAAPATPAPFLRRRVQAAIESLPEGQQRVFLRTAVLGFPLAAVAREEGLHPGSARSQAWKARRHLRHALADLARELPDQGHPVELAS